MSTDPTYLDRNDPYWSSALYAPKIETPIPGQTINNGTVSITWSKASQPSTDSSIAPADVTFEIEYTDDYKGRETNWYTLKRRIPWSTTSFSWRVGNMIKSDSVRLRMRAKDVRRNAASDWYLMDGDFTINVFKLQPPAIVSPISGRVYSDYLTIILDETPLRETYHQKVRYTLDYSSSKRSVSWTTIAANVPPGENIIRWDLSNMSPSDDYVLRLRVRGLKSDPTSTEDQFASQFIHDIEIQQPGMFLIDTIPPEGVLRIENSTGVTNEPKQTIEIFAEDATTDIVQMQLRECNATQDLQLGNLEEDEEETEECDTITELLANLGDPPDFDHLIGKPLEYSPKTVWAFDSEESGIKKIEAMFVDSGGNMSIQEQSRVYLSAFSSDYTINDFIVRIESRDSVSYSEGGGSGSYTLETALYEVAYLGTESGEIWVLEPFPRLVYRYSGGLSVKKIYEFNQTIYIFTYDDSVSEGAVYRLDAVQPTLLYSFTSSLSEVTGVTDYALKMYMGMKNGELWVYNGFSFQLANTFTDPISTLHSSESYLYIGFDNSSKIVLFDGTSYYTQDIA